MRRLVTYTLTVLAILVLGCGLPTAASALPELHTSLGEAFPVELEGVAKGENVIAFSTALSSPFTTEEVKLLLKCEKLGSLCPYDEHLVNAKFEGKTCSTTGDAEGVILIAKNEVHFVSTSTAPLDLNGDFLVAKFTIACVKGAEKLNVTVEGEAIGRIEGVKDMEQVKSFKLNLKCTKANNGKQEVKKYLNDEGKLVKGILKLNLGLGAETACEEIKVPTTVNSAKMVEFLF
jgi:hypothetical protein